MTRIGIVGYGGIGRAHRAVFEALGCEVVASCNRSAEGRARAKAEGILRCYDDGSTMMRQEQLDAVVCATPIFENYKTVLELIPFRLPILMEKPPGTSVEELEALIDAATTHGTLVMLGTNRVWYSVLRNAITDMGGLGEVESVDVQWSENPARLAQRGFSDEQIASRNFSNSIHGLSLLQYLAGTVHDVNVVSTKGNAPFQWQMALHGVSERNVIARFISSWTSQLPWRLVMTGGGRQYSFAPLEECQCADLASRTTRTLQGEAFDQQYKPGFYLQAKAFLDAVASGSVPQEATLSNARALFTYAREITENLLAET